MVEMNLHANGQRPTATFRKCVFSLPSLLFFAVALALVYFLATRFDLDRERIWDNVRTMDLRLYVLAFVLYYSSFIFRGIRWRLLARNAGIQEFPGARLPSILRFSHLIILGWFVNSVAWLRAGDAYRAYAFAEESGGHFSWSLGTVLAERVVDMVTVLVLIIIGVALFSLSRDSSGAAYLVGAAFLMAVALAVLLTIMKGYGTRAARFLPGRLEIAYHRFHAGALGSLSQLPIVLVLGLAGWLLEVGRLYFVVQALDLSIGIPLALVVALGNGVLSTVPTPGGVGAVEPGVTGLLVLGMARDDAVSAVLVDRSITYLSVIAIGFLLFVLWQASSGRRRRGETGVAESLATGDGAADA